MVEAKRRLAAILSADVAGYSRLMGDDERATLDTLNAYRNIFRDHIGSHDGRVVDTAGDSVLAVFESVVEAVHCALEVQEAIDSANAALTEGRRMRFRIGINLGDVIAQDDGTVYGDGINVAARLQELAEPGTICLSESAHMQAEGKVECAFAALGEYEVKNIAKPVRAFRAVTGAVAASKVGRTPPMRRLGVIGIAAAAAAVVMLVGFWPTGQSPDSERPRTSVPSDKPSIAVLPFKNLGNDEAQDYFAEGIAEDIITDLSKLSGLFVISRNSSFGFMEGAVDDGEGMRSMVNAVAAAAELNVRYVLQGSVRRAAESVRINVQLLDADSGAHLWAERYDRNLADTFAVQDEITRKVIAELSVRLGDRESRRIGHKYTDNMQAYDLFLRGRKLQGGVTREENMEARDLIERAIALDPDFAAAYAELSWIRMQNFWYQFDDNLEEQKRLAIAAAERAVELDGDLAAARARLAWAYLGDHQFDKAIVEGRQALALDPNYGDGYLILSEILIYAGGDPEEGIRLAEQGIPLDPYLAYHHYLHIANGHIVLGDFNQAITFANKSVAHNPDWPGGYIWLAALYGQLGPLDEAARNYAKVLQQAPGFSIEARQNLFMYRDQSLTDWMIEGLRKADAARASSAG